MKETFFHYADLENKECVKAKPYVVSADIRILLQPWADEKGFVLPNSDFFGQIRTGFSSYMRTIFPGFE